jgi:3-hydroxyacyl-CoA dehydrogenase
MEIKTIAIIGAGAMGLGVAQVSAAAGYDVVLNDANSGHNARSPRNGYQGQLISSEKSLNF